MIKDLYKSLLNIPDIILNIFKSKSPKMFTKSNYYELLIDSLFQLIEKAKKCTLIILV